MERTEIYRKQTTNSQGLEKFNLKLIIRSTNFREKDTDK